MLEVVGLAVVVRVRVRDVRGLSVLLLPLQRRDRVKRLFATWTNEERVVGIQGRQGIELAVAFFYDCQLCYLCLGVETYPSPFCADGGGWH